MKGIWKICALKKAWKRIFLSIIFKQKYKHLFHFLPFHYNAKQTHTHTLSLSHMQEHVPTMTCNLTQYKK